MFRVIHFEIHATNPERAIKFYTDVFNWDITQWENHPYWMVNTGGETTLGINGGMINRCGLPPQDGAPVNAYVCTLEVPNVDEFVDKVTQAGGVLTVPKMPIPTVGWLAYCKDTEGNIFGMMQPDKDAKY